jgi:hypothetical protein
MSSTNYRTKKRRSNQETGGTSRGLKIQDKEERRTEKNKNRRPLLAGQLSEKTTLKAMSYRGLRESIDLHAVGKLIKFYPAP